MDSRMLFWALLGVQLAGYAWYFSRAGQVSSRQFVWFCISQVCGQVGAGAECFTRGAWGTMVVQLAFSAFTAVGIVRARRR